MICRRKLTTTRFRPRRIISTLRLSFFGVRLTVAGEFLSSQKRCGLFVEDDARQGLPSLTLNANIRLLLFTSAFIINFSFVLFSLLLIISLFLSHSHRLHHRQFLSALLKEDLIPGSPISKPVGRLVHHNSENYKNAQT